jgi:LmbE family N-acetylglucosaminyl deacetylase
VSALGGIRRREQGEAAPSARHHLGAYLGLVDGELEPTLALRQAIAREVRRQRPEVVLTWSPERDWDRLPGTRAPRPPRRR